MIKRAAATQTLKATSKATSLVSRLGLVYLLCVCSLWFSPAYADQNDQSLEGYFEQLQNASSNAETQAIQNQIWQAWLSAPDENSTYLMSQLNSAMAAGQHQLALLLSNQLIDSTPKFAEAWNKRATVYYLLGDHKLSVADIKETLVLEPRHFGALSGLGLIFMSAGQYEAALDVFNKVLEISPSSDNALGSVARAKSLIGDDI